MLVLRFVNNNISKYSKMSNLCPKHMPTLNTDFITKLKSYPFFPRTDVNICTHSSLNSCPSDKKRCIGAIKASLSAQREASRGLDLFQFVVLANAFQEF